MSYKQNNIEFPFWFNNSFFETESPPQPGYNLSTLDEMIKKALNPRGKNEPLKLRIRYNGGNKIVLKGNVADNAAWLEERMISETLELLRDAMDNVENKESQNSGGFTSNRFFDTPPLQSGQQGGLFFAGSQDVRESESGIIYHNWETKGQTVEEIAEQFDTEQQEEATQKEETFTHYIGYEDTLGKIAKKYGTTPEILAELNNMKSINSIIRVGDTLQVPLSTLLANVQPPTAPVRRKPRTEGNYVVQKNETLFGIANKFNINLKDLIKWNNFDPRNLGLYNEESIYLCDPERIEEYQEYFNLQEKERLERKEKEEYEKEIQRHINYSNDDLTIGENNFITVDKSTNRAGSIMAGTLLITAGLVADDATVIGVADDVLIPIVVIVGSIIAGGVWLYDQMSKSSGKNEKHGDGGRAKTKAEKQIEDLEKQKEGATRAEKERIDRKIRNIREDAERKARGEEHSRGNKR